jgi:ParB-like chromosome segregation protein Spo0J
MSIIKAVEPWDPAEILKQPAVRLPLSSLKDWDSPRSGGQNNQHIRVLAESHEALPPIIVHRSTMQVIDGVHRIRAAQIRGLEEIEARFFDGDRASAFVLAVKVNSEHGLPLSLADRKAAAVRILNSFPRWSNRRIASVTGLAPGTVDSVRSRLTDQNRQLDVRVGSDGRSRPLSISEGRERAAHLIAENPNKSLRYIARASGISPETVRDVRARLHNNEGPVPSKRKSDSSRLGAVAGLSRQKSRSPCKESYTPKKAPLDILIADPAFRSRDAGRALLRALALWRAIDLQDSFAISMIPSHCLEAVAEAARECARSWNRLADRIDRQCKIGKARSL